MDDGPFILNHDVSCARCEYDLRGLAWNSHCPECGFAIEGTLAVAARVHPQLYQEIVHGLACALAERAGCTVDGVLFVLDALQLAIDVLHPVGEHDETARAPRHVSPEELCLAVRELARRYFNDHAEAVELLGEWGVRSSEDVGRIYFAAVRAGRLAAAPGEKESDFAGLFTLERLF